MIFRLSNLPPEFNFRLLPEGNNNFQGAESFPDGTQPILGTLEGTDFVISWNPNGKTREATRVTFVVDDNEKVVFFPTFKMAIFALSGAFASTWRKSLGIKCLNEFIEAAYYSQA